MAVSDHKKDPDAVLDYTFDWSDWLTPIGDTIQSVMFLVDPSLTVVNSTHDATKAVVFVSGGVVATLAATSDLKTHTGVVTYNGIQTNLVRTP